MRRAFLFVVLLAVLIGVVLYLIRLKESDLPDPSPDVSANTTDTTHTPAPTAASPTDTASTPSPTPHVIPSATAAPTATPEAATPTPDWNQGEAGELIVRLDGENKQVPAFERHYVLQESPYLSFRMMVPANMVEPRYSSNAWYFPLQPQGDGDDTEPAWLELSRIAGTTADELLPDFMNAYLSFTEIEFSGASMLGEVSMNETITASGDSLLVKAWLLDVPQGVFSVVLCCASDRLEPDLSYLEAMLDTLSVTAEK